MLEYIQQMLEYIQQNGTVVISLASLLISICALAFTAFQVFATRKHNLLTVRPHITSFTDREPIAEENRTKVIWRLVNHGLGPAIINSYSLFLDDVVIDTRTPTACLRALSKAFGVVPFNPYMLYLGSDYLMRKDESQNVLAVELPRPSLSTLTSLSDIDEFGAGLKRFKVVVKYSSLYGQKFPPFEQSGGA